MLVLLPAVQAEAFSKFRHGPVYFFAWGKNALSIDESSAEITALLKAWSGGDEAARDLLAERVYPDLRRMARRYMKNERQGNTLQTTDLVHEAYLRLVDVTKVEWRQRAQFFAMAAQIMPPAHCTLYDVGPNYLVMEFVATPSRPGLRPGLFC
jgi:hypothetical protein